MTLFASRCWARPIPGREDDFKRGVETALKYAQTLGNDKVHMMAGLIGANDDRASRRELYLRNLACAATRAAARSKMIVIEQINTRDIPGYFLNRQQDAYDVCREVGAPSLKVQFDLYHCQIAEGDLAVKLKTLLAGIGHIQVAGVPDRHEPDEGEVNYPYLFDLVDSLGYDGWIGCEYIPKGNSSAGLGWIRRWLPAR